MPFTEDEKKELPNIISAPRFQTYLIATNGDDALALQLYQWNLEISSAFVVPLQICEVAIRNGIVIVLEKTYGVDWHLTENFTQTLPNPRYGYNPARDLIETKEKLRRHNALTSGKIVADLKFAFWQNMLTSRHDERIWRPHFRTGFPYSNPDIPIHIARRNAYNSVEKIRKLRNRIAHHEPIFTRDIQKEYDRIIELVRWRSPVSANWLDKIQKVTTLLDQTPIP